MSGRSQVVLLTQGRQEASVSREKLGGGDGASVHLTLCLLTPHQTLFDTRPQTQAALMIGTSSAAPETPRREGGGSGCGPGISGSSCSRIPVQGTGRLLAFPYYSRGPRALLCVAEPWRTQEPCHRRTEPLCASAACMSSGASLE